MRTMIPGRLTPTQLNKQTRLQETDNPQTIQSKEQGYQLDKSNKRQNADIYQQSQSPAQKQQYSQIHQSQMSSVSQRVPRTKLNQLFGQYGSHVDPNQMVDLSNNNGTNIHPKINMEYLQNSGPGKGQYNRYKIRVQKRDKTSTRYECFCAMTYLSYTAMYHHLKTKHKEFLKANNRFSSTNMIETFDPSFGYKIKKLLKERLKNKEGQNQKPGQNLSRNTRQRVKRNSEQINNQLKQIQSQKLIKEQQDRKLRILDKRVQKTEQIMNTYTQIIESYERILKYLKIDPILQRLQLTSECKDVYNEEMQQFE